MGGDTSCGLLIDVTSTGETVYSDSSQGPYDGSDDTLIGVLNDSGAAVTSLQLAASSNIFGFDSDGICSGSFSGTPTGCPFGSTGYEGPGTTFSGASATGAGGTVSFSPAVPPGGTAYFSLEEPLDAAVVFTGGPTAGEQGGAPNGSMNSTTCDSGAPVNCATGTFWHTFTDALIPGLGVPLRLTRTYSAVSAGVNGPFGFGWTDSYNMSLSLDGAGNATVSQEDGSTADFRNVGGTFIGPPWILASLTRNGDGTYTFTRDATNVQYVFDAAGKLAHEIDRNGYSTDLAYDASGNLKTVTDQAGRTLTFAYSGGHISQVTDPMGNHTSYTYDSSGNLAGAADPLGRTWSFTYDASHLLLTMTDPRGGATTNTYDSSGRVVKQVDPAGRATTWGFSGDPTSASGSTTTITDPRGVGSTYAYANLELNSVTRAAGTSVAATTSYQYDPAVLGRTSITDANGHTTTKTYDSRGDLTSTTDPLGQTTSYTYDGEGDLLSVTDPMGTTTTYTYDAGGSLLSKSTPVTGTGDTATTTYAYGAGATAGDRLSMTDPEGNTTTYAYDAAGDRTSSTNPTGDATTATYDGDGRPLTTTTPLGHVTSHAYDAAGQLTATTDPLGAVTSYGYDGDGNQSSVTDANGHTTSFTFDPDNQQTVITRADGTTAQTSYDANGNVLTQTDGNGHTTTNTYDALNRVDSTTDPLMRKTAYSYDGVGNEVKAVDPAGRTTAYGYDADNRLTAVTYSDGSTPGVQQSYDADGRRVGLKDGTGASTFAYDSLGRLASQTNGAGAQTAYSYDLNGDVTTIVYPNGKAVTRAFDADSRLTSVTDWLGHATTFGYDADGNATTESLPGSVVSKSGYDKADRLTGMTDTNAGGAIATFSYARDPIGQVTTGSESGAVTANHGYSYDKVDRLGADNGAAFGYDASDNPTTYVGGQQQAFDAADQLTSVTPAQTPGGGGGGGGTGGGGPGGGSGGGGGGNSGSPPTATVDVTASTTTVARGGLLATPPITTQHAGDVVIALVSAQGPKSGGQGVSKPSGGGLHWSQVALTSSRGNVVGIWQAPAPRTLQRVRFTVRLRRIGFQALFRVVAFGPGAIVGVHAQSSGKAGAPSLKFRVPAGSVVWAVGHDAGVSARRLPLAGNVVVQQLVGRKSAGTSWVQTAASRAGGLITVGDKGPKSPRWAFAGAVVSERKLAGRAAGPAVTRSGSGAGPRTFGYDAEGERTSMTTAAGAAATLSYDQAGRLVSVSGVGSYTYDGDGLRMSKTVGGSTSQFAWDASGDLPMLLQDGATYYVYGPGGQALEEIAGGVPTFILQDQEGSTRLMTDANGAVAGTYTYDAWGNTVAHSGSATSSLQYDGQYKDGETGFQYLRARYYDASTGQFLTVDPALDLTGARYNYVGDAPTNLADPSGRWALADTVVGALIGGVTGGAFGAAGYLINVVAGDKQFSWGDLAGSTVGGFVGGAIAGACIGTTWVLVVGCEAVGGAAATGLTDVLTGQPVSLACLGEGAALGVLGGELGGRLFPTHGRLPSKLSNVWNPGKNARRLYAQGAVGGGVGLAQSCSC